MKFVLLIGPPGSGKSTIIGVAKEKGYRAIDLEEVAHGADGITQRIKKAKEIIAQKTEADYFVGMADVDPIIFPKDSLKIMLLPSFEVYRERLNSRDKVHEHKRGQGGLEFKYKEFGEWARQFEHVIKNDGTPQEALEDILEVLNRQS